MAENDSGKIPVMQCVGDAYAFAFANWGQFAPAAAIVGVLGAATVLLNDTPIASLILMLVGTLAGAAFTASVLRKQLRGEVRGIAGLTVGEDEFRLIAAEFLIGLMFVPVFFLLLMVGGAVLFGRLGLSESELETLNTDPVALRAALASVVSAADIIWLALIALPIAFVAAKFALVAPATIGERKLMILQTWSWTKGNTWRVVGAVALASIPVVFVSGLAMAFIEWSAASQASVAVVASLGLANFVAAVARIPLIALSGILYNGLRP